MPTPEAGPLRGQAGLFVFDEEVTITSLAFAGNFNFSGATRSQDSQSYGLFGSLSYDLSEQLTVSGGLRYTDEQVDHDVLEMIAPLAGNDSAGAVLATSIKPHEEPLLRALLEEANKLNSAPARIAVLRDQGAVRSTARAAS